jgi:two-component system sensor kinase
VNEIAQAALDKVRGLSQALHPSILEELGLDSAIESYLSNVERQLGVRVIYQRSGAPLTIDPAISIQVYRVLQEALTNVSRHSGAGEAVVQLSASDDWLELIVEDHGGGIEQTAALRRESRPTGAPRPTTGLAGMRERASLVGGTLAIEGPTNGGTRIHLRVPMRPTTIDERPTTND